MQATGPECSDIFGELESWYASENGNYLLAETRKSIQHVLDTTFGYHLLQIGLHSSQPLAQGSPILHQIHCASTSASPDGASLFALPEELPFDSDSVDTVIAHHALEFADNPHQVLRELQRVLTPQGQLLLVGFNPYSLNGLSTRCRGLFRHPLWSAHRPVSEHRLTDWLHLLGCEVQGSVRLYGVPPVGRGRVRRWLTGCDDWVAGHNLPIGGLYVLHAIKQVAGLSKPRRLLRARSERLIGLVPTPAPTPIAPSPRGRALLQERDTAA